MFLVGRLIAGIGTSICITVSPMFISELAPAHSRGWLVSFHVAGLNTGYLLASLGSLGFSFMTAKIQWRINFIIALAVAILLLLLLIFVVPESPRWLVAQGRFDEAKRVLERLHINKHDPQGLVAKAELYQIRAQCAADKELPRGFIHIFRTPSLRKRAFCTILVWFGSMGTGVLVIANLTPLLFAGLGESATVQLGLSAAWYAICIVCSFAGGLAVDRFGRRNFLGMCPFPESRENLPLTCGLSHRLCRLPLVIEYRGCNAGEIHRHNQQIRSVCRSRLLFHLCDFLQRLLRCWLFRLHRRDLANTCPWRGSHNRNVHTLLFRHCLQLSGFAGLEHHRLEVLPCFHLCLGSIEYLYTVLPS